MRNQNIAQSIIKLITITPMAQSTALEPKEKEAEEAAKQDKLLKKLDFCVHQNTVAPNRRKDRGQDRATVKQNLMIAWYSPIPTIKQLGSQKLDGHKEETVKYSYDYRGLHPRLLRCPLHTKNEDVEITGDEV